MFRAIFLLQLVYAQFKIDTVISETHLDGEIGKIQLYNISYVDIDQGLFYVGDGISAINNSNIYSRGFLSFDISKLSVTSSVDSVLLMVFQSNAIGNDTVPRFPVWNVPRGDTMFCIVDFVSIGDTLDSLDWTAGDYGDKQTLVTNIGTISSNDKNGYKYLDVTPSFIDALTKSRKKIQFRLRFPISSDFDNYGDAVRFYTAEANLIPPKLIVKRKTLNVNIKNDNKSTLFSVYPNPASLNVNFILPKYLNNVSISFFNILGQKIKSISVSGNEFVLDVSNLKNGLYFVQLRSNEYGQTKKIFILH